MEVLRPLMMVRKLNCQPCDNELGSLTSVAVLEHAPESFGVPSRLLWSQGGFVGALNLVYWKFANHGCLERNTMCLPC